VENDIKRHFGPSSKVEVFGEFSSPNPWEVRVPCTFDPAYECYKADVKMKIGHKFKFIIKNECEALYVLSKRYPVSVDSNGN